MRNRKSTETARGRILTEALAEMNRLGYRGMRLDRVAERAGVTKGTVYYYFRNKRDFASAVVDELLVKDISELWLAPLKACTDPIRCLRRIIKLSVGGSAMPIHASNASLIRLSLEMSALDRSFQRKFTRIRLSFTDAVASALGRGQKSGTVSPRLDVRQVARHLLVLMIGGLVFAIMNGERGLAREDQRQLNQLLESARS